MLLNMNRPHNVGLVVNQRGKLCLVYGQPILLEPLWVAYHVDKKQLEIIFVDDVSWAIGWEATDDMDAFLKQTNKILLIEMKDKKPVEGYDTSLIRLRNGRTIH